MTGTRRATYRLVMGRVVSFLVGVRENGAGDVGDRLRRGATDYRQVLITARRDDPDGLPADARAARIGPRRLTGLVVLFALSVVLTRLSADEAFETKFVSLAVGLSFVTVLFLGSLPVLVTWWAVTFWSGSPDFRSTLQRASDHAGRGLTLGFLFGTTALMGGILADAVTATTSTASVDRLVAFSLAGTVAGFATAHAAVLDHACRRAPVPALAWLAAPLVVLLLVLAELHVVGDPTVVFDALVRGLTSGLVPVPDGADDATVERLVEGDVRYVFLVSGPGDLHDAVLGRAGTVTAITVPLAVYLWGRGCWAYRALVAERRRLGRAEPGRAGA